MQFALNDIAPSTRVTYQTGASLFASYQTERGLPLGRGVTAAHVANWIAHLAATTKLTSATIANYKSGARDQFLRATLWQPGENPFDSELVRVTLGGIQRARVPDELAARQTRPMTRAIGPATLSELRPHLDPASGGAEQAMIWAAACVGAHALLRANEFLGTKVLAHRALRTGQIRFYSTAGRPHQAQLHPPDYAGRLIVPHRFTIALGVTKADQAGSNAPITVEAPMAVEALWRWMHIRRLQRVDSDHLFRLTSQPPLSMQRLLRAIEAALLAGGHGPHKLTSKCFRRGGAGDMVAAGFSVEAIAAHGRWRSGAAMVVRYSEPSALARRATAAAQGHCPPLKP